MDTMLLLILLCKVDALLKALGIDPDEIVPRGHYALYRDGELEHNDPARPNSYLDCVERFIRGKYSPWTSSDYTYTIEHHEELYGLFSARQDFPPPSVKTHAGGRPRKKKSPEPTETAQKSTGEKENS